MSGIPGQAIALIAGPRFFSLNSPRILPETLTRH